MRTLAVAAVVAQAGIAVTGSVVRVTGSGLGCPTWPQCFPGSLVPVPHPETQALTQWIEFGNRLLTFLVVIVAGACLVAALATRPRRRRLTRLALVQPLGVVAQAVIGGMTVLLSLVVVVGGRALHRLDGDGVARGAARRGRRATATSPPARSCPRPCAGSSRRAPPCSPRSWWRARSSRQRARTRATRAPRGWTCRCPRSPSCTPTCCSPTSACSSRSASRCARSARPRRCGAATGCSSRPWWPRARSASPSTRWRAGGAGVAARARGRARHGRRRCAVGGHHRAATWGNPAAEPSGTGPHQGMIAGCARSRSPRTVAPRS